MRELTTLAGAPIDNLAIDEDDQVYISHSSHNGVTRLDPDTGETERLMWGDLSAPGGLAAMAADDGEMILAADAWSHRTIDPASGAVTVLPVGPGVFGSTGVAVDAKRIAITNTSPAGMLQVVERDTGAAITSQFGFGAPYGVAFDSDGTVLLADFAADALVRVALDDTNARSVVAEGLGGPVGLALDGQGGAYVTGHGAGTVTWIDLASGESTLIADGLDQPEGLARLPNGKLAVAEVGTQRLLIVDPGDGAVEVAAESLPIGFDLGGAV